MLYFSIGVYLTYDQFIIWLGFSATKSIKVQNTHDQMIMNPLHFTFIQECLVKAFSSD